MVVALLVAVGFAINLWAPAYVAAIVAIAAAALIAWAVQRFAPRAIEKAASLPVVRATVEPDAGRLSDGWSMLLDGDLPIEGRPVGPDSLRARDWLVELGAADLRETYLRLVIEGRSSSTVRLTNVRAVILARHPPITKTSVGSPSGGDSEIQALGLNLDEHEPMARELESGIQLDPLFRGPYFSARQATVTRDEIVQYSLLARSTRDYVEWALEIELFVDGKRETIVLDNAGQPFRTSPLPRTAQREWDWAWYEPPKPRFLDVTERNREFRAQEESEERPP